MSLTRMFAVAAFSAGAMFPAIGAHSQTFTTLYTFQGGLDGANPVSGLLYRGGSFYGTTQQGGLYGNKPGFGGTVFKFSPSTGAETVISNFHNGYLQSTLTGPGKNIYGTTDFGGIRQEGSVFRIDTVTGKEDSLYDFTGKADGGNPIGALVYEGGVLYGATENGGAFGLGTVFKVVPGTGTLTVLHSFAGGSDGASPAAGLIYHAGFLYGTTFSGGGVLNAGTVFKIDPSTGVVTVLHKFNPFASDEGGNPAGALTYQGGVLYGTTFYGGFNNYGTVFKINPFTRAYTVIYMFDGTVVGYHPDTKLLYHSGALYGTTKNGGATPPRLGAVFGIYLASGSPAVVHSFSLYDGIFPESELAYQSGKLYGTTSSGGGGGYGTVYSVTSP